MTLRLLYLARHGETDWNAVGRWQGHSDIPLNDRGRAQALALGARLEGTGIGAIASSDLSRAQETATLVASALGIARVDTLVGLRERGYGVFEGLTRAECEARYPDTFHAWMTDPAWAPPGAESLAALEARIVLAVRKVIDEVAPSREPVLVVTHGGALRAFLRGVPGAVVEAIPNAAIFRVECLGSEFMRAALVVTRDSPSAR